MSKLKVKLDRKAVNQVCLSSEGIDSVLLSCGNEIASRYGEGATVTLRKDLGDRSRVWINAPYKNASKNNKLTKSVK